jgi:hypothetical protein
MPSNINKVPRAPKVLSAITPSELQTIMNKSIAARSIQERRVYDSVVRYTNTLRKGMKRG